MEDFIGILFFLLILVGSALEAYWKSKKKKEAQARLPRPPMERRPPPRPAPAGAGEGTRAAGYGGESRTGQREPVLGEGAIGVPEELLEWLRQGRAPRPAEPAGGSSWEAGMAAEEAEQASRVVSLESVVPRPEREPARPAIGREGFPILAPPPTVSRRRRRPLPSFRRLSTVQRAFVWAEILGRPAGDRGSGATTPPGLRD